MGIHTCPWLSISSSNSMMSIATPGLCGSLLYGNFWPPSYFSQFSVLDSGFCFWPRLYPKLNVRFAWKFVSVCVCMCACVGFVLCCLCLLLCGPDNQSEAQLLKRYLIHDMLTILIYLLCAKFRAWFGHYHRQSSRSICITLWSVAHMLGSSMSIFVCICVCVVEWTRCDAWNV